MPEPFRILIIEDDPEHAELIKMGFRRHDEFFLNFAASGEDGLEMLGSTRVYDLISVDLVLPGMGGLEAIRRIIDQGLLASYVFAHEQRAELAALLLAEPDTAPMLERIFTTPAPAP
mgnify:CR=1 FL=1